MADRLHRFVGGGVHLGTVVVDVVCGGGGMSKKDEALKQALEALEYIYEGANNQGPHTGISWRCVSNKAEPAITALREALAQDVPEVSFGNMALDKKAENARELGLDYEPAPMSQPNRVVAYSAAMKLRELGYEWMNDKWKHLDDLAEQPAQQEPVAIEGQRKLVEILAENWRVWPASKAVEQTSLGDVYCSAKGRDLMLGNHEIASDQDSAVVTKEMWSTLQAALAEQPAQRKPLGYAGITIWGGDATVTKMFTETEMKFAREPRSLIESVVGQLLDELAAHDIKENT